MKLNKKWLWIVVLSLSLLLVIGCTSTPTGKAAPIKPQCKDKIDNDGDGFCDYPYGVPSQLGVTGHCVDGSKLGDSDCSNPNDDTECDSACSTSSDCGDPQVGLAYCGADGNAYQNYLVYTCSTSDGCGACSSQTTPQLVGNCNNGCSNGVCNTCTSQCTTNADCGSTDPSGTYYCGTDDNVYQNIRTPTCSGSCGVCSIQFVPQVREYCDNGCVTEEGSGVCFEPPTTVPNSCFDTDHDGGPNSFGAVFGDYNGEEYTYIDTCLSSTELREYSCVGDLSESTVVTCEHGCDDGVCNLN